MNNTFADLEPPTASTRIDPIRDKLDCLRARAMARPMRQLNDTVFLIIAMST